MNLKSLFSLCNSAPQRAVNVRGQRKRLIHIYIFLREVGKKKKDKKKSCDRERYVSTSLTDLLLAGKGPSIEFLGRSNITIPPGQ